MLLQLSLLTTFKGAPSARQADWPRPRLARTRGTCTESVNKLGSEATGRQRVLGILAAGGWAGWPTPSCAGAHRSRAAARRADAPHLAAAHPAVTRRGSRARELAGPVVSRQVRQSPDERSQRRTGTPRIVRSGPSSVKGTPRSFLTASQKRSWGPTLERRSLCQPSGPDSEGQAKGQARSARRTLTKTKKSNKQFV